MNILNKLTIKHLMMNKKRTIVTIIGVILSTALMVGIGLLISSMRDYMVKEVVYNSGNYHASILKLPKEKIPELESYNSIKKVSYEKGLGFAALKDSNNMYKPYLYVNSVNANFLDLLNLKEGRYPKNNNELIISTYILENGETKYKVGDTITLEIGKRMLNGEEIPINSEVMSSYKKIDGKLEKTIDEELSIEFTKEYIVVGIVDRPFMEDYNAAGYNVFTLMNDEVEGNYIAYIEYKQIKDVRKKTDVIVNSLGIKKSEKENVTSFNEQLLSMYGQSKYTGFNTVAVAMLTITLSLISIACIIVIYNSFAISVMERKKQFGLFSSIGATRSQLRKTVFFEALIVGVIGIVLGLLGAFIGIGIVIIIINQLLSYMFVLKLDLSVYPLFVLIPIIFMILVLTMSAYLPAKRASRISPIEAIRLNDDIKIKGKKLKTSKLFRKIFGIEGEIALKSIKRNKKKYRITIVSLFISIVLFISFSSYVNYIIGSARYGMGLVEFDIYMSGDSSTSNNGNKELFKQLKQQPEVKDIIMYESNIFSVDNFNDFYSDEYKKSLKEYNKNHDLNDSENVNDNILFVKLDKESYDKLRSENNVSNNQYLLLNSYFLEYYTTDNRKQLTGKKFINVNNFKFTAKLIYTDDNNKPYTEDVKFIDNIVEVKNNPFGMQELLYSNFNIIILSDEQFDEVQKITEGIMAEKENFNFIGVRNNFAITLTYDKKEEIIKILDNYEENNASQYFYYFDIKEEQKMLNNLLLVINILVYGFITLVTLIGITSVFNTINTSMALRRKEFAVLRSIGLTPKGFNKILRFETLIFGLKSLLYALPVSYGIIYLIHISMSSFVSFGNVIIPWTSVIIAIVGVFVVVAITTIYSTKKIKKENILDCIREENI